ncbi:MAG: D-glycero-beta-D-manno-heptose 1-phosphate adenylyltransferase [Ignavibacteriales bacterium]|nr:D-glycero-beta-D-manno-heptose 1-phosphate adenylyltransferase [Ignavibacteriales bacterium]MBK7378865.1 D-glycero-beta-D-manno-heptose 1-phosphate adenylyltransferase [Ignavibacteriales bacterium]
MIVTLEQIIDIRNKLRSENKKVVFTNGCFDILHAGHIDYLSKSKKLGDILIVGVNSDSSIKRIKGDKRPIMNEVDRAFILSNLKPVDYVILFDENTPAEIIDQIIPDILVKGADWEVAKIIGREVVEKNGGEVKTITFVNDVSTSKIIDKILKRYTH